MIVVAQMRISEFIKVHSLTSQYGRVVYEVGKDKKHFLLLGESQTDAVTTFMNECFHTDHGKNETEIVILRESEPTVEINHILKMPQFEQKLIYIKGSPLKSSDLKRAMAHKATCCVIMSN